MRVKTVLAAGVVQDLLFSSEDHLDVYLDWLDHRHVQHKVLEALRREDGSIIIRIVKQYNNSDLIQFPEVR